MGGSGRWGGSKSTRWREGVQPLKRQCECFGVNATYSAISLIFCGMRSELRLSIFLSAMVPAFCV